MKYFAALPLLILTIGFLFLFSCHSTPPKFTPKVDSVQVVYKDSVRGPYLFVGVYQITRTFVPTEEGSTSGKYLIDTAWYIKQQADTFTSPKATHTYNYSGVQKKYVQIVTVPRRN